MGFFDKLKGSVSEDSVLEVLKQVEDPDLHKDIVSLGFVKKVQIQGKKVSVIVELTTPACPVKDLLRDQCQKAILSLDGVEEAQVEMTARTQKPERQYTGSREGGPWGCKAYHRYRKW